MDRDQMIEMLEDIYDKELVEEFLEFATDAVLECTVNWISSDPYTTSTIDELKRHIYTMLELNN